MNSSFAFGFTEATRSIDSYLAGLVLFRGNASTTPGIEYLLLKKARGDKEWQPAKGKLDATDATTFDGAIREVQEETGFKVSDYSVWVEHHLMHQYTAGDGVRKQVDMWPAQLKSNLTSRSVTISHEHSTFKWVGIKEVKKLVNKRWFKNVFEPTDKIIQENA